MQTIRDKHRAAGALYDQTLKKALDKTKFIEKRIEQRTWNIKKRFTDLKNVCRLIKYHQSPKKPQSPELPSLDSKDFRRSSDESMTPQKEEVVGKQENGKVSKSQAKAEKLEPKANKEAKKQAKLQYQIPNKAPQEEGQQNMLTTGHFNTEVKKENECERVDISVIQRSENSTARFADSEKESSFVLKSPLGAEDQSFLTENQDLQKTKNTNSFQSTIEDKNLVNFSLETHKKISFGKVLPEGLVPSIFTPQVFSFSTLPQAQLTSPKKGENSSSKKTQKLSNIPYQKIEDKENHSTENMILATIMEQEPVKKSEMNSEKFQNDGNLSRNINQSMSESVDERSLSFYQINDQMDQYLKVNSPLGGQLKEPEPQFYELPNLVPQFVRQTTSQIISQPALKVQQPQVLPLLPPKESVQQSVSNPFVKQSVNGQQKIDLGKLEVNPVFSFNNGTSQVQRVMPKLKHRLFKGKGKRKNSSDDQNSD